jgi:nitrite reductase/ring-hydroxylating ferredoxin subunit
MADLPVDPQAPRLSTDAEPAAPVGTVAAGVLDGAAVTVVRGEAGWVAVDALCSHADCSLALDGEVYDGTALACNCHGSEFDLATGAVLLGPAERPLTVIRLLVADGGVLAPEA